MTFTMTRPTSTYQVVVILILFAIFFLIATMLISSRYYKIEITDNQFLIKGLVYRTILNLDEIDISQIKMINMDEEKIKMGMRTNGIHLPSLKVGWFRMNGEKYKLYVTDKKSVLYLPTKKGYTVLISTESGDEIIKELRGRCTPR